MTNSQQAFQVFTPEQAAAWLGVSVKVLEDMKLRRAVLGRGIVRYLSSTMEEDIEAAHPVRPTMVNLLAPEPAPLPPVKRARRRPSTWVYVERRVNGLQTGTWESLELVLTIADDRNLERELHARFAEHRMSGEWFRPAPEIIEWLQANKATL